MTPEAAKALPLIYDAALNPGRWRRALDAVAGLTDARAVALLIRRPDRFARDLHLLNSTYLKFSRSPEGIYYSLRYARLQNPDWDFLGSRPVHEPTPDTASGLSRSDLDSRADYAYLRRKIGAGERLGVRLNRDRVWFDGLSLAGYGPSAPSSNANLAAILPHLTKSAEMGRAIRALRLKANSATAALNRVRVGLVAVLPSAEVIWKNNAATEILERTDALATSPQNRLLCNETSLTEELAHHCAAVSATAVGDGATSEHLMTLPRRDDGPALLLDISPLRGSDTEFEEDGALLTLVDPAALPQMPVRRFARLHGLSPAEAQICALLLDGNPVNDIAEKRNRSPVTVKNQIATILAKTGADNRADLIRLALRVMPPVT